MITPIHVFFNIILLITSIFLGFFPNKIDLILILSSELIDLDHLFSKPIYKLGRNSFKTHFLHKRWKLVSLLAVIMLFIRPVFFLGLGLLSHFSLDWLDNKIHYHRKK